MPEPLKNATEKRAERARLVEQMRAIVAGVKKNDKGEQEWTAEQRSNFDALHAKQEALKVEYEKIETETDRSSIQAELDREMRETQPPKAGKQDTRDTDPDTITPEADAEQRSIGFRLWAMGREAEMTPAERKRIGLERVKREDLPDGVDPRLTRGAQSGVRFRLGRLPSHADQRRVWNRDKLRYEQRANEPQSSGGTTFGGYTVADEPMRALEESLLFVGGVRNSRATIVRTATGGSLPIPTVNDTANEGAILAENVAESGALPLSFGQVVMGAFKYSSEFILCSIEFLQDTSIDAESFVARSLGTRLGRITNRHYTKGSNSSQPYGVQWAAGLGKTVASATAITFQEVIDLEHSVDPSYRANGAEFMFHDTTLALLKKLGDATGQWIWQPGLLSRAPDRILGYEYVINQHMDTPAAGKHSMLFGDFSKYWVRDVMDITVMRLVERYAEYAQVAFIAFMRTDGDLIDAGTDPIKYLRHPAS